MSSGFTHCQTWITKNIGGNGGFTVTPTKQFIIDPYRNAMWFVVGGRATVIESDGNYRTFDQFELETAGTGENIFFSFTPNHIYYKVDLVGLKQFDNYLPTTVYNDQDINIIVSDQDSIFFPGSTTGTIIKYQESSTEDTYIFCSNSFNRKNSITYKTSGAISYSTGIGSAGSSLSSDVDYINSGVHSTTFSRHTDTFFIAQPTGIGYAYKQDVLGNITPSNTTNMPAPNVLKLEFDMNDNLWALFGDGNDEPFSIAMLDGTNWTNIYDASNSPINFANYKGFQFDTLNNIWVAESYKLHTIENPNSPQWLSTLELDQLEWSIYPNPSEGSVHISIPNSELISSIELFDYSGRLISSQAFNETIEIHESGVYFIRLGSEMGVLGIQKVVIH